MANIRDDSERTWEHEPPCFYTHYILYIWGVWEGGRYQYTYGCMHRSAQEAKIGSLCVSGTVSETVSLLFPAGSEDMGTTVNGDVFQVSRGGADCLRLGGLFLHWRSSRDHVCYTDRFLVMCGRQGLTEESLRVSSGVSSFRKECHGMEGARAVLG